MLFSDNQKEIPFEEIKKNPILNIKLKDLKILRYRIEITDKKLLEEIKKSPLSGEKFGTEKRIEGIKGKFLGVRRDSGRLYLPNDIGLLRVGRSVLKKVIFYNEEEGLTLSFLD